MSSVKPLTRRTTAVQGLLLLCSTLSSRMKVVVVPTKNDSANPISARTLGLPRRLPYSDRNNAHAVQRTPSSISRTISQASGEDGFSSSALPLPARKKARPSHAPCRTSWTRLSTKPANPGRFCRTSRQNVANSRGLRGLLFLGFITSNNYKEQFGMKSKTDRSFS